MTLQQSHWHNFDAYTLENDAIRVVIVPERGAKIASIFDKRANREWLNQPTQFPVPTVPYGAGYIDYDMNSWDEMFPGIVTDTYPAAGAFKGNVIPDHGEVWAMAWTPRTEGDALTLTVEGRVMPYTLSRKATLQGDSTLRLDYSVTNNSNESIYFLWASHPLFTADEQTEMVLPPEVTQLYTSHPVPPWGEHGTLHGFPHPQTSDGKKWDLRRVGSVDLKDCRKFNTPPDVAVGWAGLRQLDNGAWLRMDWDAAKLPYLGIWIDEGTYAPFCTIAFEPSDGFYDLLTRAYENQKVASLPAGQTRTWMVTVTVDAGKNPIA
jgi:galactose mutarotase-like enzyme